MYDSGAFNKSFLFDIAIFTCYPQNNYLLVITGMFKTTWNTGSKDIIQFKDIIEQIKQHCNNKGTVYIGTDSFFIKDNCIFSTAICLYGADNQQGGRYFYTKKRLNKNQFPELSIRMIKEAENTIILANNIVQLIPSAKLELHLDISPQENNE